MASTVTVGPRSLFAQDDAPAYTRAISPRRLVNSPEVYDLEFTRTAQEICAHGWVTRMGYSCRATNRDEAIRNAIVVTIHALLAHPIAIWDANERVPSRDAYIELNRATPAFSYNEKMGICHYIYTRLSDFLRIKHAFDCIDKYGAFSVVLEVSRSNRKWDAEVCCACDRARDLARYPIVVFIPCEHVACLREGCAMFSSAEKILVCPLCNPHVRDSAISCASICSRMHIVVDYGLEIPTALIDEFAKKITYANIL